MHVIAVPAVMDAAVVTVRTRLVVDMEATPTDRPVQVRPDVIAPVLKFTPATVIALIEPTVTVVKERVAVTPVAALTWLERTSEAAARAALDIGGYKTLPTVSNAIVVPVVIVTVPAAAVASALFLSPATTHEITVLAAMDAGVVTVSTRLVVAIAAVPAEMPVQV